MPNSEPPVTVTNLTKRFKAAEAVRSVSWAPRRGQVTALVGLNGAGKSTLMRVMTGLTAPTGGDVAVATPRCAAGGRPLSAMIEAPALYTGLTVSRNLRIHAVLTGATRAETAEAAELAQIGHVLRRRVATLSQGYRQRTAIAVALLRRPDLLLLDEPTNALDPEAIAQLRTLIRQIADRGTAVVVSTHQLRELEGIADVLTILHEGRLLHDGPFDSFVGPASLRIRARDAEATSRLAAVLREDGICADHTPDGIRTVADDGRPVDRTARQVFATATRIGIDLVELSHVTPTLEEAFHTAISGARR